MSAVIAVDTEKLNSQIFFDDLDRLTSASIGVVAIRTRELERAKSLLHQWSSMRNMDFRVWSILTGWQLFKRLPTAEATEDERPVINVGENVDEFLTPTSSDLQTIQLDKAWEFFTKRERNKDDQTRPICGMFYAVNNEIMQDMAWQQNIREHVRRGYTSLDRVYLLMAPGAEIPESLATDIEVLDLPTPSFAELLESLEDNEDQIEEDLKLTLTDDDKATIVQNGLGMTNQEFDNAIALGLVDLSTKLRRTKGKYKVTAKDFVTVVRQRKLEMLKQTKMMELLPEARVEDVGGLDVLMSYMEKRKAAFSAEAAAFGLLPPKGLIVVGPPGTGKSLVLKVVGAVFGLPLIKVDVSAVYGSLVGSSEAKMRMLTRMLEDCAPCIAFFDEIDKSIGSGGGGENDGGTTRRVFGHLLTWMQERTDKRIPVYVVASANDVTKIPPEFLRRGRFDVTFGVSFPNLKERADILRIHVEKRGHALDDKEYRELAKLCNGYVGAELESAVEEALVNDFNAGHDGIRKESVAAAIEDMIPQSKVFPEKIAVMKEWCEKNAKMASSNSSFDVDEERDMGPGAAKRVIRKPTIKGGPRSARN